MKCESSPQSHIFTASVPPIPHNPFPRLKSSDANDQTGAVQRPWAADAELGAIPAPVSPQEPLQTQGAQEEECEKGVHAVPSSTAREQGQEKSTQPILSILNMCQSNKSGCSLN